MPKVLLIFVFSALLICATMGQNLEDSNVPSKPTKQCLSKGTPCLTLSHDFCCPGTQCTQLSLMYYVGTCTSNTVNVLSQVNEAAEVAKSNWDIIKSAVFTQKFFLIIWAGINHQITFIYGSELFFNKIINFGADVMKKFSAAVESPFHIIYPGTLWCGVGSIAKNKDEFGFFKHTDACCREHDNCPWILSPGNRLFNLYNDGIYTRSHCDCDKKFYNCLKNVSTVISFQIGIEYFNLLAPSCFTYDHPIKRCVKYHGLRKKCLRYEVDESGPLTWQWRDNKLFFYFL